MMAYGSPPEGLALPFMTQPDAPFRYDLFGFLGLMVGRRRLEIPAFRRLCRRCLRSRPETRARSLKMGAHHVVDHRRPIAEQVKAIVPQGVNYARDDSHGRTFVRWIPDGSKHQSDTSVTPFRCSMTKRSENTVVRDRISVQVS